MSKPSQFLAQVLAAVFLTATAASAQFDQGQIAGTVRDPSGSVMPDAQVTATQQQTGRAFQATTAQNGFYVITNLPIGSYQITVKAVGFKAFVRGGVVVESATRATVDVELQVGEITDSIIVTSSAPPLQAETAQIGRVVESRQISDLALNGRNPTNLALLKAGVVGSNFNAFNPTSLDNSMSINGGQANGNNVTVDGVPAIRTRGDSGAQAQLGTFNLDSIQEVQILTSTYPAEYGRAMDGQIRFVTKGGSRDFHGTAWEFFRNSAMDANSWLRNSSSKIDESRRAAPFRFNQPGFGIGGPAFIPGKFNADRSKLFFYYSEEWIRYRKEKTGSATVPSLAMRSGDFSELLSASNPFFRKTRVLNDPTTGAPFTGNIIPASRLSTNGIGLLKMYPDPVAGYLQGTANWINSQPNPQNARKDVIRVDAYLGQHRISFSGSNYSYHEDDPFRGSFTVANTRWSRPNQTGAINVTSTLAPNLVNDVTFSAANDKVRMELYDVGGRAVYERTQYGINFPYMIGGAKTIPNRIPTVAITGLTNLDGSSKPGRSSGPMYTLAENLTWIMSSAHTLKFGFVFENAHQNNNDQVAYNQNGWFTFLDSGNPLTTGVALGNTALGNFDQYFEIGPAAYTLVSSNMWEAYAQDTWKARSNLTFEFGVRYSYLQPWHAAWNDISNFDSRYYDPAKAAVLDPKGGAIISGDPYNGIVLPGTGYPASAAGRALGASLANVERLFHNLPEGFVEAQKNNFAPRFGVAYRIGEKTVLRAGAGLFFARQMLLNGSLFRNAPNQPRVDVVNGRVDAPGGAGALNFPFTIGAIGQNFDTPRAYTYSVSIQRQLPGSVVLDLAYVGKAGDQLERVANINQLARGTVQANPGVNANALRPWRGLAIINMNTHLASSSYNSFQLSADRRFRNGLGFGISYTFSKSIDDTQTPYDAFNPVRARSTLDRPHLLNINYIYELPIFRNAQGLRRTALGGWQISGVTFFRSGSPLSVVDSTDVAGVGPGSASQPWNLVGNTAATSGQGIGKLWFNTAAFAQPAAGTFGNAGLNILRGPGFQNWDVALFKSFRVHEGLTSQFRFEVFNFPNHPLLSNPGVDPRSGSFGLVTSKTGERNVQLGLKFLF